LEESEMPNLFGKPWFKSLTAWGLVVFVGATAGADAVCAAGMISPETCAMLKSGAEKVGGVLVVLGLRRAQV
jgi:hypothetical protein